MSVLLLTNTVGAMASDAAASGASLVSGYSVHDAISGPRNRTVRASADGDFSSVIYHGTSTQISHCVIARADLFKGTTDAYELRLEYSDNGVIGVFTGHTTVAAGDIELLGITGQDTVLPMAVTATTYQCLFANNTADTYETEYGKVYFSQAFDFGTEPQKQVGTQGQRAQKDALLQPLKGWEPYAATNSFVLVWANVTAAKMVEFEALKLNGGLFLWDEDGDVFPHRLEHCIVTGWEGTRRGADNFTIEANFARLKHYA